MVVEAGVGGSFRKGVVGTEKKVLVGGLPRRCVVGADGVVEARFAESGDTYVAWTGVERVFR